MNPKVFQLLAHLDPNMPVLNHGQMQDYTTAPWCTKTEVNGNLQTAFELISFTIIDYSILSYFYPWPQVAHVLTLEGYLINNLADLFSCFSLIEQQQCSPNGTRFLSRALGKCWEIGFEIVLYSS